MASSTRCTWHYLIRISIPWHHAHAPLWMRLAIASCTGCTLPHSPFINSTLTAPPLGTWLILSNERTWLFALELKSIFLLYIYRMIGKGLKLYIIIWSIIYQWWERNHAPVIVLPLWSNLSLCILCAIHANEVLYRATLN